MSVVHELWKNSRRFILSLVEQPSGNLQEAHFLSLSRSGFDGFPSGKYPCGTEGNWGFCCLAERKERSRAGGILEGSKVGGGGRGRPSKAGVY